MFLNACPPTEPHRNPFGSTGALTRTRDALLAGDGHAYRIVLYRLIEHLPYFLMADRGWARKHLVAPRLRHDADALALWRAVARRTHFTVSLQLIGSAMAEKAGDRRLGRETRCGLVFSLVVESLRAFQEDRAAAVPNQQIQQMLRTVKDEVRASAADVVRQFVVDLSDPSSLATPAEIYRSAAAPFLSRVWPQERYLSMPGVSAAFAQLPAASGEAFSDAVEAIVPFLVSFYCWSNVGIRPFRRE